MTLLYQVLKIVTNEKVINNGILIISSYYFPWLTFGYKFVKAVI